MAFRKATTSTNPFYLKCMEGCSELVMFWNDGLSRWVQKGEKVGADAYPRSDVPCPDCGKMLCQMKFREPKAGSKPFYLKCMEGCTDAVMFWRNRENRWAVKGEPSAGGGTAKPAEKTEFVCQCCGSHLEKYEYQKDGQTKTMLRCSVGCSRKEETKDLSVYFQSAKGGFWNFALKSEPLTEKIAGSAIKPATNSTKFASASDGKSPGSKPRSSRKSS